MSKEAHAPFHCERLDGANAAPRCGARRREGRSCHGPAMPNGRCRMQLISGVSPNRPLVCAKGSSGCCRALLNPPHNLAARGPADILLFWLGAALVRAGARPKTWLWNVTDLAGRANHLVRGGTACGRAALSQSYTGPSSAPAAAILSERPTVAIRGGR